MPFSSTYYLFTTAAPEERLNLPRGYNGHRWLNDNKHFISYHPARHDMQLNSYLCAFDNCVIETFAFPLDNYTLHSSTMYYWSKLLLGIYARLVPETLNLMYGSSLNVFYCKRYFTGVFGPNRKCQIKFNILLFVFQCRKCGFVFVKVELIRMIRHVLYLW